jgi:hypothetical protein
MVTVEMLDGCKWFEKPECGSDEEIAAYLRSHYVYFTANSWNGLVSFANKVKIPDLTRELEFTREQINHVYSAVNLLDCYHGVDDVLVEFEMENPGYRIIFNGRSYGYMVLMPVGTMAGVLGRRTVEDLDAGELSAIYRLVRGFDIACDRAVRSFIADALHVPEKKDPVRCAICDDLVEPDDIRDHMRMHNPNVDDMTERELLDMTSEVEPDIVITRTDDCPMDIEIKTPGLVVKTIDMRVSALDNRYPAPDNARVQYTW